jgi:hypothetical protein
VALSRRPTSSRDENTVGSLPEAGFLSRERLKRRPERDFGQIPNDSECID